MTTILGTYLAREDASNSAMDRKTQEGLSSLVLMGKFDGSVGVTAFDSLKAILSVGSAEVTLQSVQDLLAWFTFVNRPCRITLWLPSTLVSATLQAELTYFWDNSLIDWWQSKSTVCLRPRCRLRGSSKCISFAMLGLFSP